MWRHRGHRIRRHPITGRYEVFAGESLKTEDRLVELHEEHGLAGAKGWVDRRAQKAEEEVAAKKWEEETERLFREGPTPKHSAWKPSTALQRPPKTCGRCGALYDDAETEDGQPLPVDLAPSPSGRWVITACRTPSGRPVIRRAAEHDPEELRTEVHHSTCRKSTPLTTARGQLRLRIGRWVVIHPKTPRPRHRRRQLRLDLSSHEQLPLPHVHL